MQGTGRKLVNPGVSSREAFAKIDALNEAKTLEYTVTPSGCAVAGPFSEFEVHARELEAAAQRHRQLAIELDGLAARIRSEEVVPG